jgi:hypothetical protein
MSRDTKTVKLEAVSKGERITISAIAACGSTGTITLRDDSTVYAAFRKESQDTGPKLLGLATAVYGGGGNLRLELDITHVSYEMKIKPLVYHMAIADGTGGVKGGAYTVAVEDWTDGDYNDYVISVVSTKKAN